MSFNWIFLFVFAGWTPMCFLRWKRSPWVYESVSFSFFVLFSLYPRHKRLSRTLNVSVHFSLGRKMSSGLPAPLCQFPCTRSSGELGGSLILKKTVNSILCCMMPAQVPTWHQPNIFIAWLLLWELCCCVDKVNFGLAEIFLLKKSLILIQSHECNGKSHSFFLRR